MFGTNAAYTTRTVQNFVFHLLTFHVVCAILRFIPERSQSVPVVCRSRLCI